MNVCSVYIVITSIRVDSTTRDRIDDLGRRGQSLDGILCDILDMIEAYQKLGTIDEIKKLKTDNG